MPPRTEILAEVVRRAFDLKPIELAGFTLRARSVVPIGSPTLKQWIAAAQFAAACEEGSPYWVGDLLLYAANRADWAAKLDQAMALTGFAHQTMLNLTYISRHVEEPERQIAPTISHAAAVAPLERPEQTKFLTAARIEGWTTRELKQAVRKASRSKILSGRADTMHEIDVTVTVIVEASTGNLAEQLAWTAVAATLKATPPAGAGVGKSRVIAAHEQGGR